MLLLLLVPACDGDLLPCSRDCLKEMSLERSQHVPMGLRASFESRADGVCHVEYREAGGDWWTTPVERCGPDTPFSADLRGLHVDTEIEVEGVLTVDGQEHPRGTASVTTGSLPANAPVFTVEVPWTGEGDGGYVQGSFSQEQAGVFILDRDGRYVYLWMNEEEQKRDVFNARLTPDLTAFWLLLNQERAATDWGMLVRRNWFGEVKRSVDVAWLHHDLLPLADGSVLAVEGDPDDPEAEYPVWGDRIVRVHADDSVDVLWSSWNDLEAPEPGPGETGWFGEGIDWIHANSLAWNPDTETVLMGSAKEHALFEVDANGAGLVRSFGSELADSWAIEGDPLTHPHGANWTDDGELMVISTVWGNGETTAVRYTLDEASETLVPDWTYTDPETYAHIGGNATPSGSDGQVLVDYGDGLVIQEVDAAGTPVWRVRAEGTNVIFQTWPLAALWPGGD